MRIFVTVSNDAIIVFLIKGKEFKQLKYILKTLHLLSLPLDSINCYYLML